MICRLTRSPDGKFADDDLANILHMATRNPAGAFRGQGTPPVLRLVEMMSIEQARAWGLCTMNEFRVFLGLKRKSFLDISISMSIPTQLPTLTEFESFEEWNPDPEIAV
jgi:hypothetical protein